MKMEYLRLKSTPADPVHEQLAKLLWEREAQTREVLEIQDENPETELDELREKLKEDAESGFSDLRADEKDPKVLKARYMELRWLESTLYLEKHALGKKTRDFYARMCKKWPARDHDLVAMQGTDLTLSVYQGLESMWSRDSLTRWTEGGKKVKRTMFPGWIPLPTREGGNYIPEIDEGRDGIGRLPQPLEVPAIWHEALCGVCLDGFGFEGGYVSGTCPHPFHLGCIEKLLHERPECGSCRAPFHDRLWYQFCLDGKMETAKQAARKNSQHVTYATTEEGPRRRALAVPFLKEIIVAYKGVYKRGRNDSV
ncbi:hypothetical protein R1sor_015190 [Riccia sorocarpa]|uniref:RING-type domain-containing protein n=1 Tax=Riccia sorocarpa TaxID=122646 RepID=A0ABD3HDG4_9MARC